MKLGIGTYAMPEVPIWEAVPRIATVGFEAIEICAAERWPTAPRKLDAGERSRLRDLIAESGLELAGILLFVNLLAPPGEETTRQIAIFREACALAQDLSPGAPPPLASPIGASSMPWEEALPLVLERVALFGEIAGSEGCRFALEPHVHGLLDRPERVVYLMERLHSPSLGINFDISHFAVAGYPRGETIRSLAPYALHTHVKDGRMSDGDVRFLLPGEGDFDYTAYFREMAEAGYDGAVTAEVSAQIFNLPDYDPWGAAGFCFETLSKARRKAFSESG
jgi:sugar phosphate isomerase/epimerase